MLGVDRDSADLAELFDEADPAVLAVIDSVIGTARRMGMPVVAVRAGAVDRRPQFVEHLVRAGITLGLGGARGRAGDPAGAGRGRAQALLEAARRGMPG